MTQEKANQNNPTKYQTATYPTYSTITKLLNKSLPKKTSRLDTLI